MEVCSARLVFERNESMSKTRRYVYHFMVAVRQFHFYELTVCRGSFSYVQNNIQDLSSWNIHQFRVVLRRALEMHPSDHIFIRYRIETFLKITDHSIFFHCVFVERFNK